MRLAAMGIRDSFFCGRNEIAFGLVECEVRVRVDEVR